MIIIKFGFIGAGKVGFSLGKYLKENNIDISGYYSKLQHSSKEAAIFTNTRQYNNLEDLIKNSDTIFITTPDNQIADVWNEIKMLPIKEKLICHCSGSISSEVFSNINNHGAYGYSIHPMFAISDKYNSYKNLSQAFITIEGHEKHIEYLKSLFLYLGNDVAIINKENKVLYHAASVTVSNLVLGLINNGVKYLEVCGFTKEVAIKALYPLTEYNLINIKEKGVVNSLTGPIERGDLSTVTNHLNVIPEEDKELYRLLSKNILKIAKVKNLDRDYKNLEEYLGD
ncbi:MAG: DUF2520 domain-containing protein [Clostridium celatum]|nr:DUF2520 domain-containing protein [Clostridium celatum]MDU4979936.1 DUF2520 domain-containing protein [Clostridium celatum]